MRKMLLCGGPLLLALAAGPVAAGDPVADAVTRGSAQLSFRYRYELSDDEAFARDATASTLRTRLTLTSGEVRDFTGLVELGNVDTLGGQRYNSTRNGRTQYPTVPDPTGAELSQAWLRYAGITNTTFTLGRQTLIRDNERFVSAVGWRQNEQAFDSAVLSWKPREAAQLDYAAVWRVQRVFGPDEGVPEEDFEGDSQLFNARYAFSPAATLSGYAYFMDFTDGPTLSNRSTGLRLSGKWALAENRAFVYAAEFARQSDHGDNPNDYEADYLLLEAGTDLPQVSALLGYELLGGDVRPGHQFLTPLATPHKFQGWADKFATHPDAGIEDVYLSIAGRLRGATATVVYHDFHADAGSRHYGSEWDFQLTRTFAQKHALTLKAASYDADDLFADTTKLWFIYAASFALQR